MFSNLCLAVTALFVLSTVYAATVDPADAAVRLGLFTTQQLSDVSQ